MDEVMTGDAAGVALADMIGGAIPAA